MGAAISGLLLHIGDRLGLYQAMAGAGPARRRRSRRAPAPPSATSGSGSSNQAAGGYVVYDAEHGTLRAARPSRPWCWPTRTARSFLAGALRDHRVLLRRPRPRSWTRSAPAPGSAGTSTTTGCSPGALRLFRPGYAAHLVTEWLPALDGVVDKLQSGASVADVGCGLGASTIIMAQAFAGGPPSSASTYHEASIAAARKAAAEAGREPTGSRFEVARAPRTFPGTGLRPGDACSTACTTWATRSAQPAAPRGAGPGRHAAAGRADGRRRSGGQPEPGRPASSTALSTVICTPGVTGAGGRAGTRRTGGRGTGWARCSREAGFSRVRKATQTPVQPHPGGQAMTVAPIAASAASPRARSVPPMATSVRAH